MAVGRIKFWKASRGWGAIVSDEVPADVWLHYSAFTDSPAVTYSADGIEVRREGEPVDELPAGTVIEFEWEPCVQDSFRFRATSARRL